MSAQEELSDSARRIELWDLYDPAMRRMLLNLGETLVVSIHRNDMESQELLLATGFRLAEINNSNDTRGYEKDPNAERPHPIRVDTELRIVIDHPAPQSIA
jgi:hypothetical protein